MKKILTLISFILVAAMMSFAQNGQNGQAATESSNRVILQDPDSTVTITSMPRQNAPGPVTTPVDVDDEKPQTVLHYYDKHGDPLQEPVRFLATLDTVQKVQSKPNYPLYNGINVGVNFGDLLFNAFGQKYGSYDIWANVSLFNWIFPTLEMGLGYANDTPAHLNYTYKVNPSFFAKIGVNYNFLYKSNPDYQVFVGLRAGFSSFSYSLKNVTIDAGYWGEAQKFSIDGLKSNSLYGEVLAGIQVKIVKDFSLGWNIRWHFNMYTSKDGVNKPWFIPGYGASSPVGVNISAVWTFPVKELGD